MSAKFLTDIDFKNPVWNRDTWARLQGNLDPEKEKIANYSGTVLGVQDGAKATELVGFEGFAATRLIPQPSELFDWGRPRQRPSDGAIPPRRAATLQGREENPAQRQEQSTR